MHSTQCSMWLHDAPTWSVVASLWLVDAVDAVVDVSAVDCVVVVATSVVVVVATPAVVVDTAWLALVEPALADVDCGSPELGKQR